jgi:hypothetical protein
MPARAAATCRARPSSSPKTRRNRGGTELTFVLAQEHGGWNSDDLQTNNLGRFRLSVTDAPDPTASPLPGRIREILAIPREARTTSQIAAVFSYWRTTVPEWKASNDRIEALWQGHPAGTTTLVLQSKEEPRTTRLLKRGDFLKPADPVGAGVPRSLHPLPADAPPTRLTFAKWLVDPRAPTTARVFVNRMWQAYFGTGLVSTPEDFGTQSEAPSHPELLDWLAVEFMDRGWSVKEMHRLIVNSATYRQSSRVTPESVAKDPYNRFLGRGTRLRVEGEIVRDIQLAASGLLNPTLGGRSVMPPAPAFLFQPPASYAPFPWIEETGPRPLPTRPLHLAAALHALSDARDLRRARGDDLVRPPEPLEHAAPGPDDPQRAPRDGGRAGPGPAGPDRGGLERRGRVTTAFRLCVSRPPTEPSGTSC